MKTYIFIIFFGILNYCSTAQSVVFSNKDLQLVLNTTYLNDSVLVSIIEVKNLSNSYIYLPKDGYLPPNFFPTNKTILDFTNSKLGKGNPHYYSSTIMLDILKPKESLTFTYKYTTKYSSCQAIEFIYEYIIVNKTIKDNKLTAKKYLRLLEKINLTFNICSQP